jgi:hypothetical protein
MGKRIEVRSGRAGNRGRGSKKEEGVKKEKE